MIRFKTRGRFNVKRWGRRVADRVHGTAFERALRAARAANAREFVFGWNRGLGDIALGLVPLFRHIRTEIADSRIVVFTRADLAEPFQLTDADRVHVVPDLGRGAPVDPRGAAARTGVTLAPSATLFADPDPTRWLDGRRHAFPPSLRWDPAWDARADRLLARPAGRTIVAAHVASETAQYYGYVKDWPDAFWRDLIARFPAGRGVDWVLCGHTAVAPYGQENVHDLRGRTGFLELLAVLRTRCRVLIAPDSGVLTMAYYLAQDAPLEVISLWADPRQGILKQGCPSPNPHLRHVPLLAPDENLRNLSVDDVERALRVALARA